MKSSTKTHVKLVFLHCSLITLDEICKLAYDNNNNKLQYLQTKVTPTRTAQSLKPMP